MSEIAAPSAPSTNLSTGAAAAQEVSAGDTGPVTFDDLMSTGKVTKKGEDAGGNKKDEPAKKEAKESKDEGKKEAKGKLDKPESKDDKAGKPDEKSKEQSKEAKAEAEKRRLLKYKQGDKEAELDEEAEFFVKIDGKDVPVKAKDLLSNYSGKTAWDKKFSELDRERQTYKKDFGKTSELVSRIMKEQDPEMRFYHMAELAGGDPIGVRQKFLEDNVKLLEKWHTMTDDERKADASAFEAKVLKHQNQTLSQKLQVEQSMKELDAKVTGLLSTHKIQRQEWVDTYDQLRTAKESGALNDQKLTPEFVAEVVQKNRIWNEAEIQLEKLGHNWDDGTKGQRLMALTEEAFKLGLTATDVAELVTELYPKGQSTEQIVEEKAREREEFLEGKKPARRTESAAKEALFFEEI
jgi:hypothetical protein